MMHIMSAQALSFYLKAPEMQCTKTKRYSSAVSVQFSLFHFVRSVRAFGKRYR